MARRRQIQAIVMLVQAKGGTWQGSRGDKRLLARLDLTQAGEQDEKDAQARLLNAKLRWRQKPSDAGQQNASCTLFCHLGHNGHSLQALLVSLAYFEHIDECGLEQDCMAIHLLPFTSCLMLPACCLCMRRLSWNICRS